VNYFYHAANKLVVYFQPYYGTTSGHSSIRVVVKEGLTKGIALMPLTTFGQLESWTQSTKRPPDLLLVDFPDSGYRRQLASLLLHPKLKGVPTAMIDMFTPSDDPDPVEPLFYDYRLEFDPYSETDQRLPARERLDLAPMLRSERLTSVQSELGLEGSYSPYTLVCETGTHSERDALSAHVMRQTPPGTRILRSRQLPQRDLLKYIKSAKSIWSAGGYSMTWELAAHVPLSRVNWMLLQRPSEDCARRIIRAFNSQSDNEPLLLKRSTELLHAKQRFQTFISEVTDAPLLSETTQQEQ
jgi:hypothetical protein